jgi:hypothetical protein
MYLSRSQWSNFEIEVAITSRIACGTPNLSKKERKNYSTDLW